MHFDITLRVLVMDTDFYALQALNGYLAWDRRTRVIALADSPKQMWRHIDNVPPTDQPEVVILDAEHVGGKVKLQATIADLREKIANVRVVCMFQGLELPLIIASAEGDASAALLKHETGMQIAWAIMYSLNHEFIVTAGIAKATAHLSGGRLYEAKTLPPRRQFPDLTDRIRQAIKLCVIEGMPAHLAADEMGISLHTIRTYIKDGYRILESYDSTQYPVDMTPQERAFMRFTAFIEE